MHLKRLVIFSTTLQAAILEYSCFTTTRGPIHRTNTQFNVHLRILMLGSVFAQFYWQPHNVLEGLYNIYLI